jgi:hypothetical protein
MRVAARIIVISTARTQALSYARTRQLKREMAVGTRRAAFATRSPTLLRVAMSSARDELKSTAPTKTPIRSTGAFAASISSYQIELVRM